MATIDEQCQAKLRISFTDENGTALTPTTLKYKIVDEGSRTTILPITSVSPATTYYDVTITADQNRIIRNTKPFELRNVSVEVYSLTTLVCSANYIYRVKNLYKIPLASSPSPSISPSASPSISPSPSA